MMTVVVLLLMGLLAVPANAADTSASTMRLEETQGSVTVKNATGKSITLRSGAKLYSGYKVVTGSGYAWISLDSEKVVKLDRYSQVTVKKDGKKLELMLSSGSLFFNVSEPLKEDESLNIRTSTMYTSIRGTSGTISVETDVTEQYGWTSSATVTVYDGRVLVSNARPDLDTQAEAYYLEAGWRRMVTFSFVDQQEQVVTQVQTSTAPVTFEEAMDEAPFAAVEIAGDPNLQERVQQDMDISVETVEKVLESAPEKLETAEQNKEVEKVQLDQQIQEDLGQAAAKPGTGSSGSGGGSQAVPRWYTVSFYQGEQLFAQQQVLAGACVIEPLLKPAAAGQWYIRSGDQGEMTAYDFAAPVTGDLNLYYGD